MEKLSKLVRAAETRATEHIYGEVEVWAQLRSNARLIKIR